MYELVGKQNVDFYNDKNQHICGVKLHLTGFGGMCYVGIDAIHQFISTDHPCYQKALEVPLGPINIQYGRKNLVIDIIAG